MNESTIDWTQYWEDAEEADGENLDANPSEAYVCEPLLDFLDATGSPDSFADVGCGPGAVVFAVAKRYPEVTVAGFDAAEPVLAENCERAHVAGHENLCFEQAVLPGFDPDRQFDVVSSFFTLCYVAEAERAIRNLYDAVTAGGHLVFTYHNQFARAFYSRIADVPGEHLDDSFPSDPERFQERFRLVLEGESLLSYDRIHEALGTWPRSVWSVVEESERYGAWRSIPLVYVPK